VRRIISLVVVALVMAAMMLVMAMPAFAAASLRANCVGEAFSNAEPGTKGQRVSEDAKTPAGLAKKPAPLPKSPVRLLASYSVGALQGAGAIVSRRFSALVVLNFREF
jgi:hypothetical protein